MNKRWLQLAGLALALSTTFAVTVPRRAEAAVFFVVQCVNHQEQVCTGECGGRTGCTVTCRPDGNSC